MPDRAKDRVRVYICLAYDLRGSTDGMLESEVKQKEMFEPMSTLSISADHGFVVEGSGLTN